MTVSAAPVVLPSAGRYRIDPARTTIAVKVRHLFGLGTVTATFALRGADVTVGDPETATTVRAVIDAASFASGNSARDGHIRSPKFLDTATTRSARQQGEDRVSSRGGILAVDTRFHEYVPA